MEIATLILEYVRVLVWPGLIVSGAAFCYRRFGSEVTELVKRVTKGSKYEVSVGNLTFRAKVDQAVTEAVKRNAEVVGSNDPEKLRKFIAESAARIIQLLGISKDEMRLLGALNLYPSDPDRLRQNQELKDLDVDGLVRALQAKRLVQLEINGTFKALSLTESGVQLVSKHKVYEGLARGTIEAEVASEYEADLDSYYAAMAESQY